LFGLQKACTYVPLFYVAACIYTLLRWISAQCT